MVNYFKVYFMTNPETTLLEKEDELFHRNIIKVVNP